jgi:hypothetical protein
MSFSLLKKEGILSVFLDQAMLSQKLWSLTIAVPLFLSASTDLSHHPRQVVLLYRKKLLLTLESQRGSGEDLS